MKKYQMYIHVVYRLKFPALSNGALVFAVSLILCTRNWRKHFTKTGLAFHFHFQQFGRTQLTGKPSPPFERALNSSLETTL
jgi:hypothetical protein